MPHARWIFMVTLIVATGLSGCNESKVGQVAQNSTSKPSNILRLPVGTSIEVTLGTALSSETASAGMAWSGMALTGREGIPAGSPVAGTVTSVKAAKHGDHAMLDLGLSSITIAGQRYSVYGDTEAIIAGSTRARNLGAIAGGAAAGAVVGNAGRGSTEGTVIGAAVGGGAATAVAAESEGYQIVLKPGILLTFTINEIVAVRE